MRCLTSMKLSFTLVFALFTLAGPLLAARLSSSAAFSNPSNSNPIVRENRHPGSSEWQLPWSAAYTVADDVGMQIKGYTSNFAVKPGDSVDLKVTVTPAQDFQVDVLRLGYYQGYGGRLMSHVGTFHGVQQQPCTTVPITNMISCNWQTSLRLITISRTIRRRTTPSVCR